MSAFNIKSIFSSLNPRDDESGSKEEAVAAAGNESALEGEELAAVITAAVMAAMGAERKSGLVIKSIKRTGQVAPIWNRTGRFEQISGKL